MTTSRTGPTAPLSTTLSLPGLLAGCPRIPPAGRVVADRYRLRRLLGRGGMGAIWLASDQALHRPVAVKQPLISDLVTDQERRAARARLLREARLAARVDHTGTVRVYDVAEETGDPWIVMEALPGRTLQAALRDDGPLPVSQVTSLGLRLLEALAAIHRAGIVHRDVKPGNVQLCGGQRVVLTDFGIASTIEGGAGASSGGMVGSPGYVAPEQVHGGRVEPASDLFSLGATLYAAVEGRSPSPKVARWPPSPPSSTTRRRRWCAPARSVRSSRGCWPRTRRGGWVPTRRGPRSRRPPATTSPPCPVNGADRSRRRPGW